MTPILTLAVIVLIVAMLALTRRQRRDQRLVVQALRDVRDLRVTVEVLEQRQSLDEELRQRIRERVTAFKAGGGRAQLREVLARKAVSAEMADSGRPNGARSADGSDTE